MDVTGFVVIVGILVGGLLVMCAAVMWLARCMQRAKQRTEERQGKLIRLLVDRVMAGDWANLIAGERGELTQIDRSVGKPKEPVKPLPPAKRFPDVPRHKSGHSTNRPVAKDEGPADIGQDDMLDTMAPLVGNPAEEEVAAQVGR